MADVVIVGGGVIGCASAYYLSKAGASVTLVEREGLAGEASGAAAGMLAPPPEALPSATFGDLCRAGVDAYPSLVGALRDETGIDVQYLDSGILLPAWSEQWVSALRALIGWKNGLGLNLEWVEGSPLRMLEPALAHNVAGAAYSPQGHHVNPGLLTQALARAAAASGAVVKQATAVVGFLRQSTRVAAVRTLDGDTIAADHVVLAAGPWTRHLARKLSVDVPTRPMRGQMLAYRSTAVRHIVWGEEGYLVPKAGGFLFAGATVEDVGFRPATTRRGLAQVRRIATAIAPALRYPDLASDWAGLRPGSPDGLPIIGRLPGTDNVFVATGHFRNGILLGAITGRLIAQLVTGARTELPLEPFSPSRFA